MSTSISVTPSALLLLALDAFATAGAEAGVAMRRTDWLMRLLVEQLLVALPRGDRGWRAAQRFWDPSRGVTPQASERAVAELWESGFLQPSGTGREAAWRISPDRQSEVAILWFALSAAETRAVREAAQRSLARSVAWSKIRCT